MPASDEKHDMESLQFIQTNLQQPFNEEKAQHLFELYCVDNKKNGGQNLGKLEPPDIRKLLFDILEAAKWPLVVPDESLDNVLNELCLHERGSVTWVEFKSFFVFLQDRPLLKLLELATQVLSMDQLALARLIRLHPLQKADTTPFDTSPIKQAIAQLLPEAGPMFLYFLGGGSVLALVIGAFKEIAQTYQTELNINNIPYVAEIKAFNKEVDVFPPIARAGGIKSKIARSLADLFITSKKWDEANFRVGQKTSDAAKKLEEKAKQIDERYKVQQRITAFSKSLIESAKAFDEKYRISQRVNDKAKSIDEQYQLRKKVQDTREKLQNNDKVQMVVGKMTQIVKDVDDLTKETHQLIQEKEQNEMNEFLSVKEGEVTQTGSRYNQNQQYEKRDENDTNQSFVGVSDIIPKTSAKKNIIPQSADIAYA